MPARAAGHDPLPVRLMGIAQPAKCRSLIPNSSAASTQLNFTLDATQSHR
jgi:hypothetical protein